MESLGDVGGTLILIRLLFGGVSCLCFVVKSAVRSVQHMAGLYLKVSQEL
jgi:hypothetical protein